jgi:hypothetical protein
VKSAAAKGATAYGVASTEYVSKKWWDQLLLL